MMRDCVILGIDPGTTVMGYGVLEIRANKPKLLAMGILQLDKFTDHYQRLHRIFERVSSLIEQYKPEELAIEAPFFGKNVQSMLKLGRAQGVAIAAAFRLGVDVYEYAPMKIKMSITGSGSASKEQVAVLLQKTLHIPPSEMLPQLDATDGVAAALCHYYQSSSPLVSGGKTIKNWKEFAEKNSVRVIDPSKKGQ